MGFGEYYRNKTIWITGASSGIGEALARNLSKFSCQLILTARNFDKLTEVKNGCENAEDCHIFSLDISDEKSVEEFFVEHEKLLDSVDIYINNAGISQRSEVHETNFSVYRQLLEVNLLGAIQISAKMLKIFRNSGHGHFVVISSVAGKFGVPLRSGYSASKMGLHGFFDALRAENHGNDISVSMICPGYIKTDISRHALTGTGQRHNQLDKGQRNGMPVDLAAHKIVKAVAKQKDEVFIGGFRETRLAVIVSRLFPSLFRRIIRNSIVK